MLKNIDQNELEKLENTISKRLALEKGLNFSQRLFKFLYDLSYESYWIEKDMLGTWRYKTIKQEDVSYEKNKDSQKTCFSFEYNTDFYTISLKIPENKSVVQAFLNVMREEKQIFNCTMEKDSQQKTWVMTTLDAFIVTDNWFEDILSTADLFVKEWESLQDTNSKEKTPTTDTVDTLKHSREFEQKKGKFIE
jgi:hypothetical protein